MTGAALQQHYQRAGVPLVCVFALYQRIFKDIPAARLVEIVGAGIENFRNFVLFCYRHRAGALLVGDVMQRHREVDGQTLLGQAVHLRHKSAGGKAYVARGDVYAAFRRHIAYEFYHVVVIIQRLAAAHKHNVCDLPFGGSAAVQSVDLEHLRKNFARSKIPYSSAQSACAEFAAHAAADLRGYALRVAVLVLHQNALHYVAVGKAEEIFFRTVGRGERLYNLQRAVLEPLKQSGYEASSSLISVEKDTASDKVSKALHCEIGSDIYRIVRVYYADDTPAIYSLAFIPLSIFDNQPAIEIWQKHSNFEVIKENAGRIIIRDQVEISAITREVAEREIEYAIDNMPSSLLRLEGCGFDQDNNAVILGSAYYNTDYVRFTLFRELE